LRRTVALPLHRIVVIASLVGVAACGDEPTPAPPPPSEAATPAAAPAPTATGAATGNSAPRIDRISFEPESPAVGDEVRVVAEASDPDGDTVWFRYAWTVDDQALENTTQQITLDGDRASKGDILEVSVVASDGVDEVEQSTSTWLENAAPTLVSVEMLPGGEVFSGVPVTLRPEARDPDGDAVTFRYEWRVNGRRVRQDGPVLETARHRRGDTVQATVVASDGDAESEPYEMPPLTLANSPPQVVSKPAESSPDGAFRYRVEAEDADGDRNLQFELENAPEGMTIDSGGSIVWVPGTDQVGTHTVSVIVDDLQGGRTRHTFEVTVADPDAATTPAAVAE
jgi:hypothetical protein